MKAALHRGRAKLSALPKTQPAPAPETVRLLGLYVERFNRRDWDGLRELISADARLLVADRFAGPFRDAPYLTRYEQLTTPWRLVVGEVDGLPAVIGMRKIADEWAPHSIVRINILDQRIVGVVDYWHCPWVLLAAHVSLLTRES